MSTFNTFNKKNYYGIEFFSNDSDLSKIRKMDLFYIAGLEFYGKSANIPESKQLAKTLKIEGITKVEILTNPSFKYELVAKFIKVWNV
jgi:hypothetical protein